jgi:D-amino peptidase
MRVYLSVDMEGIAGVSAPGPTERDDREYPQAVDLMLGEANAAIEGALAAGAEEIAVNDSHGGMHNLPPARLHQSARLIQGQKSLSMVEGAAEGPFDVGLFVGYHARAGHPRGTIAHTYSGKPTLTTLNGRPVGEYGINALYLGGLGIPVGMVAGDDAVAEEVEEWLPWAERVVVKRAVGGRAADSLHPERACELVRHGAEQAVRRAAEMEPLRLEPPIEVAIDFVTAAHADHVAVIPGFEREGDRGVRFRAPDPIVAYRAFLAAVRLAGALG